MKPVLILLLIACIASTGCTPQTVAKDEHALGIISSIKASRDADFQGDEAEKLFLLLKDRKCDGLDKETLKEIIALLDVRHDGVRFWTARILGNIGPCARPAIPKLKQIVPQADCWPGGKTSASDIRETLKRFGEPSPPETICTGLGEGHPKAL